MGRWQGFKELRASPELMGGVWRDFEMGVTLRVRHGLVHTVRAVFAWLGIWLLSWKSYCWV